MENLFLYGTLCDDVLLRIVLGEGRGTVDITPAELRDHGVFWARDQIFPTIEARSGAQARGIVLRNLSAQDMARLNFYEGGFGYDLKPVTVSTATGQISAQVYFPRPGQWQAGADWSLSDWQADWGVLSRLTAAEAMGYFGRFDAAALAARMPMMRARAASRLAATGVPAHVRCAASADMVEEIAVHTPHAGFYVTRVHDLRPPRFDGARGPVLRREVLVGTDAAIVLPYDAARDRVLLVEQFRMGPYGRGDPRPFMLEPVAGRVDPGETPDQAARRECREEAGVTLHRLEKISSHYCSPGSSTEYFHLFLGLCDLDQMGRGQGGLDSEDEDIRTHVLPFDAAMALLDSGEADNGPLILSLIWLARERSRLRASA